MDDPILLKQQIEFLEFELEDARRKEVQTKSMYESMLKSFSSPPDSSAASEELKILKENHSQELKMIESKQRQLVQTFERKIEDITNTNLDLQENIKRIQARHEENITQFKYDIIKVTEEKSRVEYKLKEKENDEKIIEKLNTEISKLKSNLDQQKFVANEEIMQARENCNKNLEDLRKIYDSEKLGLQKIIEEQGSKITKLTKGFLCEEFEEILNSTGSRLDDLQNSQSLALEACTSLRSILSNLDKSPADLLENHEILIKLLKNLEKNESKLRETIRLKDQQISNLTKEESITAEAISERDSEILKLKKTIGDLRVEAEGTSKPPMHTPKSKHGRSRTAFQPTENSPGLQNKEIDAHFSDSKIKKNEKNDSIECEICKYYISSSKIDDHMISCKLENDLRSPSNYSNFSNFEQRYSIEKNENMEKQVNELKLALGKLKNQRDRARVAGEHLLLHLKNAKLQLAVSEERTCEIQMELKKEIKNLIKHLLYFRCNYALPLEAIADIDRLVNKSSRLFGGKMHFHIDD